MIKLSGSSVKDENNINGDIEIIYTGLRNGEKLFEELLIDSEAIKTSHSHIYRAKEKSVNYDFLLSKLAIMEESINQYNLVMLDKTIKELVPEWEHNKKK